MGILKIADYVVRNRWTILYAILYRNVPFLFLTVIENIYLFVRYVLRLIVIIARQRAMHAERDAVMSNLSVRPSVCLSVCLSNGGTWSLNELIF